MALQSPAGALYPVLPLRDIVVFPHMIVPLFVGREKSVRALEDVMQEDKHILLLTQKDASQDDPAQGDLYTLGTVGTVLQLLKLPDGTVKVSSRGEVAPALSASPKIRSSFRHWPNQSKSLQATRPNWTL
jgi:ATP-dependent Lon protease